MRLLLDTHLLLWASMDEVAAAQAHLPSAAAEMIDDLENKLFFSVVSIWEVAIKHALQRPNFTADPHLLRRSLLEAEYVELPVTGVHAAAVGLLPPIHKDPFDRMLIAQATVEGMLLLTADRKMGDYSGPIQLV